MKTVEEGSEKNEERQKSFHVIALIALGVAALLLVPIVSRLTLEFDVGRNDLHDEGTIAYVAYRALLGESPHVGFPYYYAGGWEILLASVFKIFGVSLGIARSTIGVVMALTVIVAYRLNRIVRNDHVIAFLASFVTVCGAFAMNFHIYPAWCASMCIVLATFLLTLGVGRRNHWWFLAGGACVGIATSMKQNAGILALLALVLFILSYCTLERTTASERPTRKQVPEWLMEFGFAFLLALPVVVLCLLIYLIHSKLDGVNVVLYLSLPFVVTLRLILAIWRQRDNFRDQNTSMLHRMVQYLLSAGGGFMIGLLPIVGYYVSKGALTGFVRETFFMPSDLMHYAPWGFLDPYELTRPFLLARKLVGELAPLAGAIAGILISEARRKRGKHDTMSYLLLLDGLLLMTLLFTQYPRANYSYSLYLSPLVVLPFAFLVDRTLKRMGSVIVLRGLSLGLFALAIIGYVATRSVGNTVDSFGSRKFGVVEDVNGKVLYPIKEAAYIFPMIDYMQSRPAGETFVAYDVYNLAVGFFSRHPIQVNYFQKHLFGGYGDKDIRDLETLAKEKNIDTIILGRPYMMDTDQEKEFFHFLDSRYNLVVKNSNHLIYQRIVKR